jgi:hypothetical protein
MATNQHDDLTSFVTLLGNTATRMGSHYSQFSSSFQARAAEHNTYTYKDTHRDTYSTCQTSQTTSPHTRPHHITLHYITPYSLLKRKDFTSRHTTQDTDIYAFYRLKYNITKETM